MSTATIDPPGAGAFRGSAADRPRAAPPRIESSFGLDRADALARAAARLLGCDVVPIARAAARLVAAEEWTGYGYARQEDFARERLGRTGRWLRQAAALGRALARWPQLVDALDGRDGGPRLGSVAAGRIAAHAAATNASEAEVAAWVECARRTTLRELEDALSRARSGNPHPEWPPGDGDLVRVVIAAPASVHEAFAEVLALHRQVEGYEATVASFVEALCAETGGGPAGPPDDAALRRVVPGPPIAERVREAERAAALRGAGRACVAGVDGDVAAFLVHAEREMASARAVLERTEPCGDVTPWLTDLLRVEQCLHNVIGRMLVLLGTYRAWSRFGFADAGHYAEQRLGITRTLASDCRRIARVATRVPQLADDWSYALISTSAALHVARVLEAALKHGARPGNVPDHVAADPVQALAGTWVTFAQTATVKRVRDEAEYALDAARRGSRGVGEPLFDRAWRRAVRDPRRVDVASVTRAVQEDIASGTIDALHDLRLTLDRELACRFLASLDRAGAERIRTFSAADPSHTRWIGLLEALVSYAGSWALPRGARSRPMRCDAPGCTARQNLHRHHVTYRSHGGGDEDSNCVGLCAFHHLQGEHGGLMAVHGVAPDGLTYRVGPPERARWYRNEREVIP